jgi:hypothetical protein
VGSEGTHSLATNITDMSARVERGNRGSMVVRNKYSGSSEEGENVQQRLDIQVVGSENDLEKHLLVDLDISGRLGLESMLFI